MHSKSKNSRAGLAVVAMALMAGGAMAQYGGAQPVATDPTAAVKCGPGIQHWPQCHPSFPTGCSAAGEYDGYLNFLKNQLPPRDSTPVKTFTSLADYSGLESRTPRNLGQTNHAALKAQLAALGEGQPYEVIGYLDYAEQQHEESTNCELPAPADTDYHIGIGFDAASPAAASHKMAVVVEMTPQYRGQLAPEWTLEAVEAALGKQVKVIGQLMADNEHNVPDDNCALPNATAKCWRASIWELHPVSSIQVCTLAGPCTADGAGWADLGKAAAGRQPARRTKQ